MWSWGLSPGPHTYFCTRQMLYHGVIAPALFLPFIWGQGLIEFPRLGSGVGQALNFQPSWHSLLRTGDYRPVLPNPAQLPILIAKERDQDPPDQRTGLGMIRGLVQGTALFFLQ